jgi:hypothetical protein
VHERRRACQKVCVRAQPQAQTNDEKNQKERRRGAG